MWDEAGRLTDWLGDIPVEAQLLKLSEEVGEVAEAYLGRARLQPAQGSQPTPGTTWSAPDGGPT